MSKPLTIDIDFDNTWTADPVEWFTFYHWMIERGHTLILATGRQLKEKACHAAGHTVNIWIDDMPGMIQDCRILGGDLTSA